MVFQERTVWGDFVSTVNHHMHGVELSLNGTVALLLRRWSVVAGCTAAVLIAALVVLALTPPQYTAQGMMQINTRQQQLMSTNVPDITSGLEINDSAIRSEIDVIRSRKLAERVIEKLGIEGSTDFGGRPGLVSSIHEMLRGLLFAPDVEKQKESEAAHMTAAVNAFLDRLNVAIIPRSYSIQVEFTSHDPKTAANVVNTLAEEYLNSQLEDRLEAARRATAWMSDRAKVLQKRVEISELAERTFREEHNLTEAKGVALSDQQLSELNSQLILARTEMAQAQAKASNSGAARTSSEVLNSPLIQNLRIQETEVRRQMSDLSAKYGDRHPRMVTIRNELADVQRKIAEESGKIRSSLGNDVDVAAARVKTLEDQLAALQDKNRLSSGAGVQLAELTRQAESDRVLYESFLNRSKEIAQMDFVRSDARVIYEAEVPLGPSKPNKPLFIVLATMLGFGLGVGLVLLLEAMDSGFRTVAQLEKASASAVLGMLAELPADANRVRFVTEKPSSAFTEGVRAVRTALGFAKPDTNVKVILVTSSVPQEGKSLFAASLAQVAAMGGHRVLLIDGDMRRPTQAKSFGLDIKAGLAEVLAGQAALKSAVLPVRGTSLSVLASLPNTQFAQELLGSGKMKALLDELRKDYDTIVIDSPPVMAVADAQTLSTMADASLYMVRWGTTPRPLAMNGMRQMLATQLGITGVVMTRVDMERQKAYGFGDYGFYYGKYKDYYTE